MTEHGSINFICACFLFIHLSFIIFRLVELAITSDLPATTILKIRKKIGFENVSEQKYWDYRNILASLVPIRDVNDSKASFRCLVTLTQMLAKNGLLTSGKRNNIRLQIDGHCSRTNMGVETINAFICISQDKQRVGAAGEYHVAVYKGNETPEEFRTNFKQFVEELCDLIGTGIRVKVDENFINYTFRLQLCSDYAALFKLLACGHWCSHFRCVICYFDARKPCNTNTMRNYSLYRSSFKTLKVRKWSQRFEPMIRLDPELFEIIPDFFHMKLNIARSLITAVRMLIFALLAIT